MKHWLDVKWLLSGLSLFLLFLLALQSQPKTNSGSDVHLIEEKIVALQNELSKQQVAPDLTPITQNIKQLEGFIQQLKNKDEHQLGELFSTEQASIKKQLDSIIELMQHLDKQQNPISMLPPNQLPFQVLSIDSVQEIPLASVRYHYKNQVMEESDSLAGWKVIKLDFAKQYIEFANKDKTHSVVRLEALEVDHD